MSMVDYPSPPYASILKNSLIVQNRFNNRTDVSIDELKRNILAFSVFYSDLNYESLMDTKKMEYVDLIAGIGGTLGLFLGMSFLSFFEVFDLLFQLLFASFYMIIKKSKAKVSI